MVSTMHDSHPRRFNNDAASSRFPRHCYYYTPPPSSPHVTRSFGGRSMRTFRSTVFKAEQCRSFPENVAETATDGDLAARMIKIAEEDSRPAGTDCSCDISGELQRLSALPDPGTAQSNANSGETTSSSTEITECISTVDLYQTVKLCVDGLNSSSIAAKRSSAAKLRVLAKNRADNRALIGESGAVPALLPLLRCSDPTTQEHAVTALLNLSLLETNKHLIFTSGAVKSLIHVLKTGTSTSKQNAACGLLSLASTDKNKLSIGASGAIPPLVSLLKSSSSRGKHDALTTLYKLCSTKLNKERAVGAGAVRTLVGLVGENIESGLAEKAAVVMSSLAGTEKGREAIVAANGMSVVVEAIEKGNDKVKAFAVLTVEQLCGVESYRELFVEEGGLPPLLLLSQSPTLTPKTKNKAENLLQHVTQSTPMEEPSSSSSS